MPRILIVKTSSLGDVVHMCPAISDAARARPGLEIHWAVEEAFAGVPRLHRDVARVIPVATRRWRNQLWRPRTWGQLRTAGRELGREPYDAVIDAQGLLRSALLAMLATGPRHGFAKQTVREPMAARFYKHAHAVPRDLHAVERNRRLVAAALGYEMGGECDYGLRVAPRPGGNEPMASAREATAVLLCMSSRVDKLWPEANWVALGGALAERGLKLLLPWGTQRERERAARLARAIGSAAEAPERMSLEALAERFAGARVVVGGDTGLTHLALACSAPTLGIYCASDPALTGLWGGEHMRNLGGPGTIPFPAEAIAACESLLTAGSTPSTREPHRSAPRSRSESV